MKVTGVIQFRLGSGVVPRIVLYAEPILTADEPAKPYDESFHSQTSAAAATASVVVPIKTSAAGSPHLSPTVFNVTLRF